MNKSIVARPEENDNLLSTKELAKLFKIEPQRAAQLLKRNFDQLQDYITVVPHPKRPGAIKYYISRAGAFVLNSIKNINPLIPSMGINTKKQVAERAMSQSITLQDVENIVRRVLSEKPPAIDSSDKLFALAAPTKEVPELTFRDKFNKTVREYTQKYNHDYQGVYNRIYSEFYYRYKVNLSVRARKAKLPPIDYADQFGYIEDLYNLALKLLT